MRALIVTIILLVALPAVAHTPDQQAEWEREWLERARLGLTIELVAERVDFEARHLPVLVDSAHRGYGSNTADWSGLVLAHFPASELATALRIIACESGGNPNAYNPSGASGLFQVMDWWAPHFGYSPSDLFSAEINVAVARKVWDAQGWRAWACY